MSYSHLVVEHEHVKAVCNFRGKEGHDLPATTILALVFLASVGPAQEAEMIPFVGVSYGTLRSALLRLERWEVVAKRTAESGQWWELDPEFVRKYR